jgi:hypothetical protein
MSAIRDKLGWALAAALSLLLVAALAGVVRGGPLDPPSSPGPTQEGLLFQPASCAGFPITINQSGSYEFAQNITMPAGCAKDGIMVTASNVTLDLKGFELVGTPGAVYGIQQANAQSNMTVRDGTIRNWPFWGVYTSAGGVVDGVRAISNGSGIAVGGPSGRSVIRNCVVSGSTDAGSGGWAISSNGGATIQNCRVENNAGYGIAVHAFSVITDTTVIGSGETQISGSDHVTIENCNIVFGDGAGISVSNNSVIRGCSVRGHASHEISTGDGSTLEDCTADGGDETFPAPAPTAGYGIAVGAGSTVSNCTARNNGDIEILGTGVGVIRENCVADGANSAGEGIQLAADSIIRGCTARNNGSDEIEVGDGSSIENCVAIGWNGAASGPGDGIRLGNDTVVRGCNSRFNGGDGIRASGQLNRIEGNRTYSNGDDGLAAEGGGNVCIQNTAGFNGTNYEIAGGNNCPVITGTAGATNPFANVQ